MGRRIAFAASSWIVDFSDFARIISEQAGMTIDVEDAFGNDDQDGDGTLSSGGLDSFRQEQAADA